MVKIDRVLILAFAAMIVMGLALGQHMDTLIHGILL